MGKTYWIVWSIISVLLILFAAFTGCIIAFCALVVYPAIKRCRNSSIESAKKNRE